MNGTDRKIILASTSPRRREILSLLGVPFEVVAPKFEEPATSSQRVSKMVADYALAKAGSVEKDFPGAIIIASDTLIELDGEAVGKPKDKEDAVAILGKLRGRKHLIWTAVFVVDSISGAATMDTEKIEMEFKKMSEQDIRQYVASGEPLDKAGAYSLQGQGRPFIASLKGDFLAAVGMQLKPIAGFLRSREVRVALDVDKLYRDKDFMNWKSFA